VTQATHDDEVARLALEGGLFTQDHLLKSSNELPGVKYSKRDFLFRAGTWRGKHQKPAVLQGDTKLLVIGHSDYSVANVHVDALRLALGRKLRVWASNLSATRESTSNFPIGLTNKAMDSPNHRIFGNQSHIVEALEVERFSEPNLYANFTTATAPKYRDGLLSLMREHSIGRIQSPEVSDAGRVRYLTDMRRHGFVLCPRGNGIDTCRLFEALSVGAVPVLKRDEAPLWLLEFPELPVILVESWLDLLTFKARFLGRSFAPSGATVVSESYWVDKLKSHASALS